MAMMMVVVAGVLSACGRGEGEADASDDVLPTADTVVWPNPFPGDEPLPPGIGASCAESADCDEGLVCVLEDPPSGADALTCQLPCLEGGACSGIYAACLSCDRDATPPHCEDQGCE